jgi:hypothetical protein
MEDRLWKRQNNSYPNAHGPERPTTDKNYWESFTVEKEAPEISKIHPLRFYNNPS